MSSERLLLLPAPITPFTSALRGGGFFQFSSVSGNASVEYVVYSSCGSGKRRKEKAWGVWPNARLLPRLTTQKLGSSSIRRQGGWGFVLFAYPRNGLPTTAASRCGYWALMCRVGRGQHCLLSSLSSLWEARVSESERVRVRIPCSHLHLPSLVWG